MRCFSTGIIGSSILPQSPRAGESGRAGRSKAPGLDVAPEDLSISNQEYTDALSRVTATRSVTAMLAR
jgi:hypothetical protein